MRTTVFWTEFEQHNTVNNTFFLYSTILHLQYCEYESLLKKIISNFMRCLHSSSFEHEFLNQIKCHLGIQLSFLSFPQLVD